jgi:SH3-like domain-containing protein
MKLTKLLMVVVVSATMLFVSCKPKDGDIKAAVEKALKADPMMANTTVDVKDGIVTMGGECKDDACKAMCEKTVGAIKGVKSVVNNCTVTPVVAPPVSVAVSALAMDVQQKIKDGLKDIKGLTGISFSDKGAVLMGEVTKADNLKIKQILGAAKVALDAMASNLNTNKMALQDKYAELLQSATSLGVSGLSVAEQNGVLHVAGTTKSTADYDSIWALYDKIDPGMNSGDLVLNLDIKADAGAQLKVTTDSSNLNIRSTPSTEGDIVGKAAHDEVVTLVEKTDDSWWKIKTANGEEGYAYAQYLSPM